MSHLEDQPDPCHLCGYPGGDGDCPHCGAKKGVVGIGCLIVIASVLLAGAACVVVFWIKRGG